MSAVHICASRATAKGYRIAKCPDCKKRTRMLEFFTPWYGWDETCLRCGRSFMDGEWADLGFVPGYWGCDSKGNYRFMKPREYSIESAKRRWRAMPPVSENHYGLDQ